MPHLKEEPKLFSNFSNSLTIKTRLASLLLDSNHQTQYTKNYELVHEKYKKYLSSTLTLEELKSRCETLNQKKKKCKNSHEISPSEAYIFLAFLVVYEVGIKKRHSTFLISDWETFAANVMFCETEHIIDFSKRIFRRNQTNFNWTKEEDLFLEKLLTKNCMINRVKWVQISNLFNKDDSISQIRTAPQCKQRWENTLKCQFKIGAWENTEDITILNYVLLHGPKWAVLSKELIVNRTQHSVKNRFFSLLSAYTTIPIRKIKKEIDYLNKFLIIEALDYHKELEEMKNLKKTFEEQMFNVMNLENENSLNYLSP